MIAQQGGSKISANAWPPLPGPRCQSVALASVFRAWRSARAEAERSEASNPKGDSSEQASPTPTDMPLPAYGANLVCTVLSCMYGNFRGNLPQLATASSDVFLWYHSLTLPPGTYLMRSGLMSGTTDYGFGAHCSTQEINLVSSPPPSPPPLHHERTVGLPFGVGPAS